MVGRDEHKAALSDFVDPFCSNKSGRVSTLSTGRGCWAARTLIQVARRVARELRTRSRRRCELAGGADKLREKRREWARLRKERAFLANS